MCKKKSTDINKSNFILDDKILNFIYDFIILRGAFAYLKVLFVIVFRFLSLSLSVFTIIS